MEVHDWWGDFHISFFMVVVFLFVNKFKLIFWLQEKKVYVDKAAELKAEYGKALEEANAEANEHVNTIYFNWPLVLMFVDSGLLIF